MSNTKRDKYDEATTSVMRLCEQHEPYSFVFEEVRDLLRSAFPPPAEDMMVLVNKIRARDFECGLDDEIISSWFKLDDKQAAAEIESFAQSRVEPWREALRSVDAWFTEYNMHWRTYSVAERLDLLNRMAAIQDKARALLSDSPAKEKT